MTSTVHDSDHPERTTQSADELRRQVTGCVMGLIEQGRVYCVAMRDHKKPPGHLWVEVTTRKWDPQSSWQARRDPGHVDGALVRWHVSVWEQGCYNVANWFSPGTATGDDNDALAAALESFRTRTRDGWLEEAARI